MNKRTILVADDHTMVRAGLVALLQREPELSVIDEVPDGRTALGRIEELKPDLALVDFSMPGMTGLDVVRAVRRRKLPTRVVVLSIHRDIDTVRAALEAGALGYLAKESAPKELPQAVNAAMSGSIYLSPKLGYSLRDVLRSPFGQENLTPREEEVLRLLARGLTSKQIASNLGVGTRTVESHRASLMEKLDVRSVANLVKCALKRHLVSLDED